MHAEMIRQGEATPTPPENGGAQNGPKTASGPYAKNAPRWHFYVGGERVEIEVDAEGVYLVTLIDEQLELEVWQPDGETWEVDAEGLECARKTYGGWVDRLADHIKEHGVPTPEKPLVECSFDDLAAVQLGAIGAEEGQLSALHVAYVAREAALTVGRMDGIMATASPPTARNVRRRIITRALAEGFREAAAMPGLKPAVSASNTPSLQKKRKRRKTRKQAKRKGATA